MPLIELEASKLDTSGQIYPASLGDAAMETSPQLHGAGAACMGRAFSATRARALVSRMKSYSSQSLTGSWPSAPEKQLFSN